MERSPAQAEQQRTRDSGGRYADSAPCEACGKPAGHAYWSSHGDYGYGLTLCNRSRCPANQIMYVEKAPWPEYVVKIANLCADRAGLPRRTSRELGLDEQADLGYSEPFFCAVHQAWQQDYCVGCWSQAQGR